MRFETRPVRPAGWWLDALLVAGFVAITILLAAKTPLLGLDLAVRDFVDAHRPGWADTTLRVFNRLGQGGQILTPLAVIVAFFLTRARHTVRPFLLVVGAYLITYVTIGPLKIWTDRAAASEHTITHPEWLFRIGSGMSYPSGHVVNAIVWYGVLATLLTGVLRPRLVAAIRYTIPLVLLFTTTYLSFHWITDGLAALMLGVLLDRVLRRVPWDAIPLGTRLTKSGWAGAFYDTQEPARITR
ncbi:phosphatase PAP2 family protein [Dactylosporangium sp. CA-233914]|uniref:phosphatase PAP2 family protein n=1 Tax=Dactylosporangium sp. CA-233914 TaxID=3239934 RepID=UPI003D8B4ACF